MANSQTRSVLCVDDDRDIAEVVQAVLTDEGYTVSCLYGLADDALIRAIGRLEPDCLLLDSADRAEYGEAWEISAMLLHRRRPVPVVMFSAHQRDIEEAQEQRTQRAREAGFAAIVPKPFHLDELITAVAKATGRSIPFDRSNEGEAARTKQLVKALAARGAKDVRPARLREWALFRDSRNRLVQIYWWQGRGVYQVGRYSEGGRLVMLGQFADRDAAIEVALPA